MSDVRNGRLLQEAVSWIRPKVVFTTFLDIPDFTFVDAAGETIIWEHLGRLSIPAYKESWERKLKFYHSIGFKEGENLFTTEDHENGAIDTTEVMEVIEKIKDLL